MDRLTWKDYEADLERKLEDLHDRVQRGAYRALPSRRVYIPKPDGRQRPLGGRDVGCIMHLAQFGFGDGGASRGEFATQSRSL